MADFAGFVQCPGALDRCAVMRAHLGGAMAWICAALGSSAILADRASLWPSAAVPAWPAGTLGLLALAACGFQGDIRPRALGTLCASSAVALCTLEVGALWTLARVIP